MISWCHLNSSESDVNWGLLSVAFLLKRPWDNVHRKKKTKDKLWRTGNLLWKKNICRYLKNDSSPRAQFFAHQLEAGTGKQKFHVRSQSYGAHNGKLHALNRATMEKVIKTYTGTGQKVNLLEWQTDWGLSEKIFRGLTKYFFVC